METANNHWWNPAQSLNRMMLSHTLAGRGLAMTLDLMFVSALQVGLTQVFGVYHSIPDSTTGNIINGDGFSISSTWYASMSYIWLVLIVVAYFTLFELLFAATLGKALLGLRVVMLDGRRLTFRAVFARNLFRLVDVLPALYIVGFLVAQNTVHEQRVGDILAKTTVVQRASLDAEMRAVRHLPLKILLLSVMLAALVGGVGVFQYYGRGPLVIQSWANNSAMVDLSTPITCGPLRAWASPDTSVGHSRAFQAPGRITQYAIGAPQWGDGVVTYPIRVQVWNSANDSGYISGEPPQMSMDAMPSGADVYNGSITLRWAGPLAGGWMMQSGQITC